MIYVDESEPEGDPESQFCHRKVNVKRSRDVRAVFHMLDEIGRGKFGKVMRCRHSSSGEIYAAKFVLCSSKEDRRNVEREVEIMNLLKSPKLLQLYDAYDNGRGELCLITEYIGGGELLDRVIEEEFVLTERACVCFMKQILEGVSYLHHQQIIHLDLKPENILCLTKTGNRIKIIDFGLARKFEPMKTLQVLFGTPEFVAPEVVGFEPISYATDLWAVGVICYVLLSGLSPFMGDTDLETMANVTIAEYDYEDEAFDTVSEEAKDFIDRLLIKKKELRSSADQCLKHPWIVQSQTRKGALSAAKQNLSTKKDHWDESGQREFMFDRPSKTISMALDSQVEADEASATAAASASATAPNEPTSPESSQHLTVPVPISASASTDSVKSSGSAVITLDQIKRKAEEICERKNSFCSTQPGDSEDTENDVDEDEEDEEDEDTTESDQSQEDGGNGETNTPKCCSPCHDQTVHVEEKEAFTHHEEIKDDNEPSASATFCNVTMDNPTLWQAAERTVTPLWEMANSPSTISQSNSELSLKNMSNSGLRALNKYHSIPNSNPVSVLKLESDSSSWEQSSLKSELSEVVSSSKVESSEDSGLLSPPPLSDTINDVESSTRSGSPEPALDLRTEQPSFLTTRSQEYRKVSYNPDKQPHNPGLTQSSPRPFGRDHIESSPHDDSKDISHQIEDIFDEVDKQIQSSMDSLKQNQPLYQDSESIRSDITDMKRDLSRLKSDISETRDQLSRDTDPLLHMMDSFTSVQPRDSSCLTANTNRPESMTCSKEMMEVEKAMAHLAQTISDFNAHAMEGENPATNTLARRDSQKGIFQAAQGTGAVNQTKSKIERKLSEPFQAPRQHQGTPFRSGAVNRSSSPALVVSIRKRSPSPVKTGRVNRVRTRFEPIGAADVLHTSTLPRSYRPGGGRSSFSEDTTRQSRSRASGYTSPTICSRNRSVPKRRSSPSRPTSMEHNTPKLSKNLNRQDSLPSSWQQTMRPYAKIYSNHHNHPKDSSASDTYSFKSIPSRLMGEDLFKDVKDAASFLSQKLPVFSASHSMKAPSMVSNYLKSPFRMSDG